jgi:D-amino-acid oxidase
LAISKHKNLSITIVAKHMPGDYDIEYASPWAGANVLPVGKPGSQLQKFEEATWPELDRICRHVPEAGIHYQKSVTLGRTKDAGSAIGEWFSELVKEDAWFAKTMPDVSNLFLVFSYYFLALLPNKQVPNTPSSALS